MKLCPLCQETCWKAKRRTAPEAGGAEHRISRIIRSMTDPLTHDGLICMDLTDLKTVIANGGFAVTGTGEASGEGRAVRAAEAAILDFKRHLAAFRAPTARDVSCAEGTANFVNLQADAASQD